VTGTATTDGVRLTWDAVDGAEEYRVRRDQGNGGTDYAGIATVPAGQPLEILDADVTAGTTYQYRVAAVAGDDGAISDALAVTVPDDAAPMAPRVRVELHGRNVTVMWDPAAGADTYRVQRAAGPDAAFETLAEVPASGDLSHDDRLLERGVQYRYRVESVNEVGTATSGEIPVTF
jgi:fibronectin type 3 domain-containing protein